MLKKLLGRGNNRNVYKDLNHALKIAKHDKGRKNNYREWEIWQIVKDTQFAKFFCPCISISDDHTELVMQKASKAETLLNKKDLSFIDHSLADINKLKNLGILNGNTVIVDYGHRAILDAFRNMHLGGHYNRTHIDEGVLKYLKKKFNINTMLDIGCGPCGMKSVAEKYGVVWAGIDGDPTIKCSGRLTHDYTKGFSPLTNESYDLGWSTEFLEHVSEEYIDNYMKDFSRCKYVVVTSAPPGKKGHHHVNCQTVEYWIEKFAQYGFTYNEKVTVKIRKHSSMKREFMRNTGTFYENTNTRQS